MLTCDDIIDGIIGREGRAYTNDPSDRGGPTRYGITQATLSDYLGRPAMAAEVSALTEDRARDIYLTLFIVRPRFGEIADDRLRALAVDCGVLHGRRRAAQWLQDLVGVKADGAIGEITLRAVNKTDPHALAVKLLCRRQQFLADLVQHDSSQLVFLEGWVNRCNSWWMALA